MVRLPERRGRRVQARAELLGVLCSGDGLRSIERNHFLPPAAGFLINVAALFASAWFSNPNTAAYFRPTTCAITKLMLIPASPSALAMAWPRPGLLSPSTSRTGMDDCARPAARAAAFGFLPETG